VPWRHMAGPEEPPSQGFFQSSSEGRAPRHGRRTGWVIAAEAAYDALVSEAVNVAVVGAGQAGLSLSHELSQAGIEHVGFDRGRVGQSWRGRWDSFCLVIPNWTVQLPGGHYEGDDPGGFMPRDDIVRHLVDYAGGFRAPVREETPVSALGAGDDGGFVLTT